MDSSQSSVLPPTPPIEMRLIDVPISDENVALNVLVSFLNVAQKRGVFSIAESAKIFECIQKFIQQSTQDDSQESLQPPFLQDPAQSSADLDQTVSSSSETD